MKFTLSSLLVALISLSTLASAHGVITQIRGANGVTGAGFGVIESTPRDGSRRRPFQQDASIIDDEEIEEGEAGPCGRTLAGGINNVQQQLASAVAAGLPTVGADGMVAMTLHQVNGDGAGPYTCAVSADASAEAFIAMAVVTNVPGRRSRSRARATPFDLVAQMPAGVNCTGGAQGNACIVRCRNSARNGPFGGCVAVALEGGDAAAAEVTLDANANITVSATQTATAAAKASGVPLAAAQEEEEEETKRRKRFRRSHIARRYGRRRI